MSDRSGEFSAVLARSSLGAPEAQALIRSVPPRRLEHMAAVVRARRAVGLVSRKER